MEKLENILELMNRMRLITDTTSHLRNKFNIIDTEPMIDRILSEGVFKSYDAEDIYRILLKSYSIGYEQTFIENNKDIGISFDAYRTSDDKYGTKEISVIMLVIPKNFPSTEKIKKLMEVSGWMLADMLEYDNPNYICYSFEKNRQTDIIENPQYLYHLTPENKLNKILKNGLTPHAGNKKSDHMERIYFFQNKPDYLACSMFVHDLWLAGVEKELFHQSKPYELAKDKKRDIKYALLEIDTAKCNDLELYGDPNLNSAVWTFNNIPPQAISVIRKNI